jgi:8-oxo-dGTP pyrophosphatase MutT (NUDIX family)
MVTELHRSAVRVVLVDASNRVLLLHVIEPKHPEQGDCWELPGGGIDPGENLLAAAQRELHEETGLHVPVADITSPRWFRSVAFLHAGVRRVQDEAIGLATICELNPAVEASALSADEDEIYLGHCWWTVDEIEASDARFFPTSLPRALRAFLAGARIQGPFEHFS